MEDIENPHALKTLFLLDFNYTFVYLFFFFLFIVSFSFVLKSSFPQISESCHVEFFWRIENCKTDNELVLILKLYCS